MPELSSAPVRSTSDAFKAANLRQRVITAVVIGVGFLALVLFSSPLWFAIVSGIIFLIAMWEWSLLVGFGKRSALIFCTGFLVSAPFLFAMFSSNDHRVVTALIKSMDLNLLLFWAVALGLIVSYPDSGKYLNYAGVNIFLGLFLFQSVWSSLCFLKLQQPDGILILVAIAIIALADIGAYFVGVRFGAHKLAPNVSPGKSWEGVVGGMLCNLLFAVVLSWHKNLSLQKGAIVALVMLATATASVIGDLFESMVKRHRGVKDSGTILPGHGGVLDRIDGWMAAIPVFAFAYLHGWIAV